MLPGWPAPLGDDLARVFTEPLLNCPTAVQPMTEGTRPPPAHLRLRQPAPAVWSMPWTCRQSPGCSGSGSSRLLHLPKPLQRPLLACSAGRRDPVKTPGSIVNPAPGLPTTGDCRRGRAGRAGGTSVSGAHGWWRGDLNRTAGQRRSLEWGRIPAIACHAPCSADTPVTSRCAFTERMLADARRGAVVQAGGEPVPKTALLSAGAAPSAATAGSGDRRHPGLRARAGEAHTKPHQAFLCWLQNL